MGQATTDLIDWVRDEESKAAQRARHRAWVGRHGWRDTEWVCRDGRRMRVIDMTPEHASLALGVLQRNALSIAARIQRHRHAWWELLMVEPEGPFDPDDYLPRMPEPNLRPDYNESLTILRKWNVYRALTLRATLHLRELAAVR